MHMRPMVASIVIAAVLSTPLSAAPAENHIVSPDALERVLVERSGMRDHDIAVVSRLLAQPLARSAPEWLRIEPGNVEAAVATLSDSELRELSSRAEALHMDTVAGYVSFEGWEVWLLGFVLFNVLVVLFIRALA